MQWKPRHLQQLREFIIGRSETTLNLLLSLCIKDEYPYASSQEGGAGAITRCVPAHENSVQVRTREEEESK